MRWPRKRMRDTIRLNQDEFQWIVAQRVLSALTILEVLMSSAQELSFEQRLIIEHTSTSPPSAKHHCRHQNRVSTA